MKLAQLVSLVALVTPLRAELRRGVRAARLDVHRKEEAGNWVLFYFFFTFPTSLFSQMDAAMFAAAMSGATVASAMAVDSPVDDDGTCPGCQSALRRGTVNSGPNAGRIFISCPKSEKGVKNVCGNQFKWLHPREGDYKVELSDKLKCKTCGLFLKKGIVKKPGPNKDKIFWTCQSDCEGSFQFDSSTPGAKLPSAKKADHDALAAKHDALCNLVFLLSTRLAELEGKVAKAGL